MTTHAMASPTSAALLNSQEILDDLLAPFPVREFAIRFWDGTVWEPTTGLPATFTLILPHQSSVRCMFWPHNDLTLPEAYVYGDIDVEGDMIAFLGFLHNSIRNTVAQQCYCLSPGGFGDCPSLIASQGWAFGRRD